MDRKFVKINKEEYKKRLKEIISRTYFHETEWHEFLEKEFQWLKFEYYSYQGGAVLAFGRTGEKLISLPFCEYGGPLSKTDININEFEKDIAEEFKNIKIKYLSIHPLDSRISGKADAGSNLSSHRLDLKNKTEQELWDSLRKTLRYEIKNAQDKGLEVRKYKSQKELEGFYNLYVANLKRKKTVPYPWSLVRFLCQIPSSELLLVVYRGKIVGGSLFLQYGNTSHYFLSATDHKYRNFGIAHLILWEKIKSLVGKEIVLDLGASPKGSALEIFKRGWGGTEYPIYQIGIKRSEEGLRSSKLIRFLWGLLPIFLIKKLSSKLIKYRL